ncbi:MAG: lipoprotein [Giesbergeria sp.]|nr:lipoprotein [Giesbergeria sp.]MBP6321069.1 lipoprotein [Giesbergeria sp.]MBP7915900.1 lipoprotein [Giesbergeria sp.]MBP8028460.1 lipoprotein [Giesbergeria sp.]MBP8839580.1 lipoprotein [Giesbergeria sp.]
MLKALQILARHSALAASVAVLCACGQRGPLFLPTDASAGQPATLAQTLTPAVLQTPSPSAPRTTP